VVGSAAESPREPAANVTRSDPAPRSDAAPVAPKPVPAKPEARSDDGARARALLEGAGPAASKPAAAVALAQSGKPAAAAADANKPDGGGRFVVQVGAYSEANSARDMRQRIDKLGLKSFTQEIEVDGVKRIRVRVGPFAAREDAEKAAGTLKAAGLPAAVFTL
jgi:DedD protein